MKEARGHNITPEGQVEASNNSSSNSFITRNTYLDFTLYVRAYWPKAAVIDGSWTPPVEKQK